MTAADGLAKPWVVVLAAGECHPPDAVLWQHTIEAASGHAGATAAAGWSVKQRLQLPCSFSSEVLNLLRCMFPFSPVATRASRLP
jgi:hypothetical protein